MRAQDRSPYINASIIAHRWKKNGASIMHVMMAINHAMMDGDSPFWGFGFVHMIK